MKAQLEKLWLCVQIIAGLGAIAGAVIAWNQSQIKVIEPVISASMPLLKSQWFYSDSKTACDISTHWEIKNEGKDVLKASGISYKVLSVKDKSTSASRGEIVDTSMGELLKKPSLVQGSISLLPKTDIIPPDGIISRDIAFNFYPDSDNPAQWFANNRLAVVVTSTFDVTEKRSWCFWCPTEKKNHVILSSLSYTCK